MRLVEPFERTHRIAPLDAGIDENIGELRIAREACARRACAPPSVTADLLELVRRHRGRNRKQRTPAEAMMTVLYVAESTPLEKNTARRRPLPRHQALARSPRRASRSTARSGIVMLNVAPIVPGTRRISPPCARTSSAAMARPRPEPPARVEPWNASNRWARAFSRHAGPGVGHLDHHDAAFAPAGDADLIAGRDRARRALPAPASALRATLTSTRNN